jgi:hypothetical protein
MIVEVKGIVQPDSSIYARKIEVEDFFNNEVEVEGIIDSLGTDWLSVLGMTFFVDANTLVFDADNNPIQFTDLTVGLKVKVKAERRPDSTLLANRIRVKNQNNNEIELKATIDSLDAGIVTVAGIDFAVNNNTLILDHANNPISFNDLSIGLLVELKALRQPDGTYLAVRIKIENSPSFSKISGTVISVSQNFIVVSQPGYQVKSSTVILNENYQPTNYSNISVGQDVTLWSDSKQGNPAVAMQIKINKAGSTTGVGDNPVITALPTDFELGQNYPNPFNPTTTIPLTIRSAQWQKVELVIYNSLGQKVRVLFSGLLNAGSYQFEWDGLNQNGTVLSSGIYLYQIKADNAILRTKRMLLIK